MRRKWNFDDGRAEYEVIALSGGAELLKHLSGRMELRGGTEEERRKLKEWVEQFMPKVARRLD